ncbi:MAG: Ig-like domain-containing protein [Muribaculaceae bacterium]|nr:Ig-like domain-containing protein [Muribaculaceae bacterium]
MKQRLILLLVTILTYPTAWAWEGFSVVNEDGVKIDYEPINSVNVKVYYVYSDADVLRIPETIEYKGSKYKVVSIGNGACSKDENLEKVYLPNSVIEIGNYAFYDCEKLTEVGFSKTLETIGEFAFYGTNLYYVNIPYTVHRIGKCAFAECLNLDTVIIPEGVEYIGGRAFGCLSRDKFITLYYNAINCSTNEKEDNIFAYIDELRIGDKVQKIPDNAFFVAEITSVHLPETLTSIGKNAFLYSSFTSINIPESVTYIGDGAFLGSALTSVTVPSSITYISPKTFQSCSSLTSVTIPHSVTYIGSDAFFCCENLAKVINWSDLDIVKGSRDHGWVAYYAKEVIKGVFAESITLNKTSLQLYLGKSETLIATVKPDNTTDKTVSWASSDEAIATVDSNGKVTAVKAGTATITATCGSVSATCLVTTVAPIKAESIKLSKESIVLQVGETETLVATVKPEETTDNTVTWSSSNEDVATVDENGKVTAVAYGTAYIIATCGSVSATCKVSVEIFAEAVELNMTKLALKVGDIETLVATVLPINTTDKTVTWTSANDAVATIDKNGTIIAIAVGTTSITSTCGNTYANCNVTVYAVPAESVILNKNNLELKKSESVRIVASVYPEDTTDKTVIWKSSNMDVASVDRDGIIVAVSEGTAIITATCGNASASCDITVVKESTIESLFIDEDGREVEIYDLHGIRVAAKNVIPGVYIRRVWDKVEKVLVK